MADMKTIIRGNEAFGKAIYAKCTDNSQNLILSPFSAHTVLAMAMAGAGGSTKEAFSKVLGIPDINKAAEEYNELTQRIAKIEGVTFKTANKIYLKEGYPLKENFKAITETKFHSSVEPANFGDSQNAAKKMNTWVEEQTNSKIKDLISPDSLDALTRLVMINAVYFKVFIFLFILNIA